MELKKKIEFALRDSMKNSEEDRKRVLRLLISSIRFAEIDRGKVFNDDEIQNIIQKEIKIRKESIDAAISGNRQDLVTTNNLEIKILEEFLPMQMSHTEIQTLVKSIIEETGSTGLADMKRVMKLALERVKNRAPNNIVSSVVKDLLT